MYLNKKKGYVSRVSKTGGIPTHPHWAIVRYESVGTSSGYPDDHSSETMTHYYVFKTEEEWLSAVADLQQQKIERGSHEPDFIAFHVDQFAIPAVNITVRTESR